MWYNRYSIKEEDAMPISKRSNASGVITCVANDSETVQILASVLMLAKEFNFPTEIVDEAELKRLSNYYSIDLSFLGDGRVEYLWNIENFSRILENKLHEKEMFVELKILQSNSWMLNFNFADENADDFILYEALASIEHRNGDDISHSVFTLLQKNNYCPTWGNMLKICGYDIDWILDSIDGMGTDVIKEEVVNNLDSLCFFYDCSIQQLFEKLPKLSKLYDKAALSVV